MRVWVRGRLCVYDHAIALYIQYKVDLIYKRKENALMELEVEMQS